MSKIISFLTTLVFVVLLASCAGKKSNSSAFEGLTDKLITKIEQKVTLTQEQKDKIAKITTTSGLEIENEQNKDAKSKYKTLLEQIKQEVLTAEQRNDF